jgi:hypothetical protein
MKTLYGLEIFVHTPESRFNYVESTMYDCKECAWKAKKKRMANDKDRFIVNIRILDFKFETCEEVNQCLKERR